MAQNDALLGQEAVPEENQPVAESPVIENQASMEALLEEEGLGLDFPKQGEIRQGVIASIGENEVLVSIGTKSEGVIPARELDQLSAEERERFQEGSPITVFVVNPEDSHGNVLLSYLRSLEEKDWKQAEELLEFERDSRRAYQRLQQRRLAGASGSPARFCARFSGQRAAPHGRYGQHAGTALGRDGRRADLCTGD